MQNDSLKISDAKTLKNLTQGDWKRNVIKMTFQLIEDFHPIKSSFYWRDDRGIAVKQYLRKPDSFVRYEFLASGKKEVFALAIKSDPDFKRYFDGVQRMNHENYSIFSHLKNCIKYCDDYGNEFEKELNLFMKVLSLFEESI